jgi:hypothetical protein
MPPGVTVTVTEPGVLPPEPTPSHEPAEAFAEKDTLPLESETMSF